MQTVSMVEVECTGCYTNQPSTPVVLQEAGGGGGGGEGVALFGGNQ